MTKRMTPRGIEQVRGPPGTSAVFSHRPIKKDRGRTGADRTGSVHVPPAYEELWLPATL